MADCRHAKCETYDACRLANMSRADRMGNCGANGLLCNDGAEHRWQPVSFRFETQLLDGSGRVVIRQPDLREARVYMVCLGCNTHTYVVTEWAGYYLGGPGDGHAGPEPTSKAEHRGRRRQYRRRTRRRRTG